MGRYGGSLAKIRTDDLAAIPLQALMERNTQLDKAAIDEVVLGCANQAGEDNRNVARMAALLSGMPPSVPGVTVNRLCASGLEAVGYGARAILAEQAHVIIVGGVEGMSRAPYVLGKSEVAFSRGLKFEDTTMGWRFVNPRMQQEYGAASMPETAENVARDCGISRTDQDAFSYRSQKRAAAAQARDFFAAEIVSVRVIDGKDVRTVARDEHLRPETTLEGLAKLTPIVREDGTVTAGNSSGINDGAAALLLASDEGIRRYALNPRARIIGCATVGVPPRIMGIGPIPATKKLLHDRNLSMRDFECIEVNEAFAAQCLAVTRAFDLEDDDHRVNPNGGAIALGHPLGASGARLTLTAIHMLEESRSARALITLCVGVGQGMAMAVERV